MPIKTFGDMLVCSSYDCRECELGSRDRFDDPVKRIHTFDEAEVNKGQHLMRTCGFGDQHSPVMLVGETPRDMVSSDGGRAAGAFYIKDADFLKFMASEWKPVVRAVQRLKLPVDAIYSTTALKCALPKTVVPNASHEVSCLTNHLGVEIEALEPAVIWVTGKNGLSMTQRHFGAANIPDLSPGEMHIFDAPSVWRFPVIMVARSPHPSQIRHGASDYRLMERVCAQILMLLSKVLGNE